MGLPRRRELILSLAKRDLLTRYKGSMLGLGLGRNHSGGDDCDLYFYLCGDLWRSLWRDRFTTGIMRCTCFVGWSRGRCSRTHCSNLQRTIVNHANLVKRVVFPLETLPVAQACSALANQLFATIALLLAVVIIQHQLPLTALWFPVVLLPQLMR